MEGFKFDPQKLEKLNDPDRLKDIPPGYIWEKLKVDQPHTVVDLGAGTGFYSMRFAEFPGVKQVYALDISEEMISYIRRKVVPGHPKISPLMMEESAIPLPDHSADVLIMINLHHEFHEPDAILEECRRVLKPGSSLAIVDWAKKQTEHGPPVEKRYWEDDVVRQLEKVPFTDIRVYRDMASHFLVMAENGY